MTGRPLMLASLLGASIGVPYVVSNTTQGPSVGNPQPAAATPAPASSWPSIHSSGETSPPPPLMSPGTFEARSPVARTISYPTTATPAGSGFENLAANPGMRYHTIQEVFRFDVSKEWVYQNWDRKSTGLGDPELFGIRVALVTGTKMTDLAGALTYLFDSQGQVRHISFRGRTADTTPLVQFLTQTYQFQRMEPAAGDQLYQVRSGQNVYSELRSRPESVLIESAPHGSFGVVLELGRPGSNRPLKPSVPALQIPEVVSATPADKAAAGATGTGASDSAAESAAFFGPPRPPTAAEESQQVFRRWPN